MFCLGTGGWARGRGWATHAFGRKYQLQKRMGVLLPFPLLTLTKSRLSPVVPLSSMLRCPWCSTVRTAKTTGWDWVKFHQGDDSPNPQAVWIQPSMDDKVGVLHWHTLPETPQVASGPALRKIWVKGEDYKGCLATVTNTHTHTNLSVHSSNPPCQSLWQHDGKIEGERKWHSVLSGRVTAKWQSLGNTHIGVAKQSLHNPFTCLTGG